MQQDLGDAHRGEATGVRRAPVPGPHGGVGGGQRKSEEFAAGQRDLQRGGGVGARTDRQVEGQVAVGGAGRQLAGVGEQVVTDVRQGLLARPLQPAGRNAPVGVQLRGDGEFQLREGCAQILMVHRLILASAPPTARTASTGRAG
ncbi:hypothetical protein TR51_18220 [Kitasatospora griseola]|uniref:Uncharacterized protein n=1 Tax=Kitasatospora griseola TaxID=2064 RepID=A0A0D0Q483_KITGR|nr:hypothetical protein TR51_18220 [Kitasatospora griseola]